MERCLSFGSKTTTTITFNSATNTISSPSTAAAAASRGSAVNRIFHLNNIKINEWPHWSPQTRMMHNLQSHIMMLRMGINGQISSSPSLTSSQPQIGPGPGSTPMINNLMMLGTPSGMHVCVLYPFLIIILAETAAGWGWPPSRTNTHAGMMHSSPSLASRQPPIGMGLGGAVVENHINAEIKLFQWMLCIPHWNGKMSYLIKTSRL